MTERCCSTTRAYPMKIIALSFIGSLGSAINIGFIFPITPPIIRHFGYPEKDVGYYSGIVSGARFIGIIIASSLWGWAGGRWSYKSAMVLGLIMMSVTNFLFGFTFNLAFTVIIRLLTGVFDSCAVMGRAVVHSISHDKNQAVGLTIVASAFGFGPVIGAVISSALLQDIAVTKETFVERYPCFYVSTAISICLLFFALIIFVFMPTEVRACIHDIESFADVTNQPMCAINDLENNNCTVSLPHLDHNTYDGMLSTNMFYSAEHINAKSKQDKQIEHSGLQPLSPSISLRGHAQNFKALAFLPMVVSLFSQSKTRKALCCMISHGFIIGATNEIISLFLQTDRAYGGLGITASLVGYAYMPTWMVVSVVQIIILPLLQRRLSTIRIGLYFNLLSVLTLTLFPLSIWISGGVYMWVGLLTLSVLMRFAMSAFGVCATMLVLNSCSRGSASQISGVSLAAAGMFRVFGSCLGGFAFAWSIQSESTSSYPVDVNFSFQALALVCVVCGLLLYVLPNSLNGIKE